MSMEEVIAQQPAWLGLWLNWLMIGGFVLPATLLIWRSTRISGLLGLLAGFLSGYAVFWLFGRFGYVKLLGLPHILFWTPYAVYLAGQVTRGTVPRLPRWIMIVILGTLLVSLAFDYVDVIRYLLGERTPLAGSGPAA